MIKDITELNFPKIDGTQYATLSQATVTLQDMAEKTITTQVKIDGQITPDFSYDWEITFKGEKYIMPLRRPQGAKENTSTQSTVDLTFQHWAIYQLKRWYFFTIQPGESGTAIADKYIATVSLNLKDFCTLFGQILSRYYGDKIRIDLNDEWKYDPAPTVVEINYSYNWDVLIQLYELYGVRWQIEPDGDVDHYVIKVGYPTTDVSHIFEYGFNGGLLKFEQQVQDENIRNMILGRGGSKNLPYRYFKKHDDENETFSPDPDWIPELKDIYFSELHGATFRSYIQGWKARHIEEYRKEYPDEDWTVTTPSSDLAYAPWAWEKGYNDAKFDPVEYVKDDESIRRYGELMGGLDNNEDIYPTIQGVEIDGLGRIDEAVAVSEIKCDEIIDESENDAGISSPPQCKGTIPNVPANSYKQFTIESQGTFGVSTGKHADLEVSVKVLSVNENGKGLDAAQNAEIKPGSQSITVVNIKTGEERSASGIPEGTWKYRVSFEAHNMSDKTLNIVAGDNTPHLIEATTGTSFKNTWDIWVKNIWGSFQLPSETAIQYAERVWRPILGDHEGNEAKVAFSDGMLALSEDYEFTIVSIPTYDIGMSIPVKDENGNVIGSYPSHWRITLAKSDVDLETTGKLLPSTTRFAEAGNHFFFLGIDMPHLYVVEAEKRLDNWKKDNLETVKDIKPAIVIQLDKVRIYNHGKPGALIDNLIVGNTLRIADKRFIVTDTNEVASYDTMYLQSITYNYLEPTDTEANILPDVEVVLSDKYEVAANPVAQLSGEVSALQKQIGSVSNVAQIVRSVGDRRYLRKDTNDRAAGRIELMQGFDSNKQSTLKDGVLFGGSFAEGVTGFGGKIDRYGDAWLGGLHLRDFLEVPELRYNRTEISIGNAWNAPGGGVIESVSPDYNTDGTLSDTGTITLHLEDGEIGAVAVDDLCEGIFHDGITLGNNATADSDDGRGNFHFAGFSTVYFRITQILDSNRNSVFCYRLREVSERWKQQYHPSAQMHFVGYGNKTNPERRTSRYATRTYERYLRNVKDWEIDSGNIGAQFGDLSNLSLFGMEMSGYSAYLNNIYMSGRIEQLDLSPRMEVDYGNDNFMAFGETRTVKCRVFRGWEDVTDKVEEWSVTRDTGNPEDDAAWADKSKVKNFNGELAVVYDDKENDLGTDPLETGAVFTFTARTDGMNAVGKVTLRRNPKDGTAGKDYTQNLLLGSEFPVIDKWTAGTNVGIDNTHTFDGRNSIRNSQSGLEEYKYRGITQYYAGEIKAGDVFTASAWCYCEDLESIDGNVRLEIQVFAGDDRVATGVSNLMPTTADEWQQAKTTVTVPEGATSLNVSLYVSRNGTVWYSSPKLERGSNVAPVWTPNPADRIAALTEQYYLSTSNVELAGGSWSDNKQLPIEGRYYWTRTKRSYGDGTVDYTTPLCATGDKGEDGMTITSTAVTYQASTSGTETPTGLWLMFIPKVPDGQYLWTRTVVSYSNGTSTTAYSVSRQGLDGTGVTVVSAETRYAKGNYPSQPADDKFILTEPGTLTQGQWLWTRTTVMYSDGTSVRSYAAAYIGADGADGLPGAPGTDGKTPYVHFAYASVIAGSLPHPTAVADFSTTPFVGAKYIGVCSDYNKEDPTTNVGTAYEWSEYKGADGNDGKDYTNNLLKNSDFADGFNYWKANKVTLDPAKQLDGRDSALISASGLTSNKYYGLTSEPLAYNAEGVEMTFSISVQTPDRSSVGEQFAYMELRCLDANKERKVTYVANALPTINDEWQRISVHGKTVAGTCWVEVAVYVQRNGIIWLNGPKLEFGINPNPQWTPYAKGEDAYTVILTNESHVFEGDTEKAVVGSAECGVIAYKGEVAVPATIGTVSGMPAGMSVAKIDNGTTKAKISVDVSQALTTKQGTLRIPVTVDGHTFEKTFSWALSLKGATGAQGIQGCIYRATQWMADKDYHNDTGISDAGMRFIDIVLVPNPALQTKAEAYICKETHTSSGDNAPGTDGGEAVWTKANSMAPIYTPLLLADGAVITLLQSNQVIVMKDDGKTVNAALGKGNYPLWVGATDPRDANFSVDAEGKAKMTEANVSGKIFSGIADGQRVELQPDNKAMKIFDENGEEASSFEGNTYNDISDIYEGVSGNFNMLRGSGDKEMTGDGLGTNFYNDSFPISDYEHTNTPAQIQISGYLYTYHSKSESGVIGPVEPSDPSAPSKPGDSGIIGPAPIPLYNAGAHIALYLDTYSDSSMKNRIGRQEVAYCSKEDGGTPFSQKIIKTTTGGYHVLTLAISMHTTGKGATALVRWGSSVSGRPNISGSFISDSYMSKYFANGFCLGLSSGNYVMAYNQSDAKGMRFIVESNGYGIDVSNAGIRHKHHHGNWIGMPLFVMKARYSYSKLNGTYSQDGGKSFNGSLPKISRTSQGYVRLTFPDSWSSLGTLSAANLIVNVVGYGVVAEGGDSPVKANIRTITATYIDITLSDDETLNDGSFMIDISLME